MRGWTGPAQVDEIKFLTRHGRAILADDMGLGKTRQAVIAMNEAGSNGVMLVICPASLELNGEREIHLVQVYNAVEVIGVKGYEVAEPRWVVVNYDQLAKNAERHRTICWSGGSSMKPTSLRTSASAPRRL